MSRDLDIRRRRVGPATQNCTWEIRAVDDSIELFMQQWRRERPDLDPTPLGVFGRIHRIVGHFNRRADTWLSEFGLTWESFSLIVTLRRAGKPYALRPTDLLRESLLSSGAVTNRIDRVEALGLVRRVADPGDRRAVVVQLTPRGRALADRAIKAHFAEMERLLAGLTTREIQRAAILLSRLLFSFEQLLPDRPKRRRRSGHN
jgi:DNA-binding MarR family transcriptional regulator